MAKANSRYVLDAFAVMALVRLEPGGPLVRVLARASSGDAELAMSAVNWGEMLYSIERRSNAADAQKVAVSLEAVPVEIVPADKELAQRAAGLKLRGRLSFADCFAAALAQVRDAAVVTGDPEFHSVENLVAVEWLPQRQA